MVICNVFRRAQCYGRAAFFEYNTSINNLWPLPFATGHFLSPKVNTFWKNTKFRKKNDFKNSRKAAQNAGVLGQEPVFGFIIFYPKKQNNFGRSYSSFMNRRFFILVFASPSEILAQATNCRSNAVLFLENSSLLFCVKSEISIVFNNFIAEVRLRFSNVSTNFLSVPISARAIIALM